MRLCAHRPSCGFLCVRVFLLPLPFYFCLAFLRNIRLSVYRMARGGPGHGACLPPGWLRVRTSMLFLLILLRELSGQRAICHRRFPNQIVFHPFVAVVRSVESNRREVKARVQGFGWG